MIVELFAGEIRLNEIYPAAAHIFMREKVSMSPTEVRLIRIGYDDSNNIKI